MIDMPKFVTPPPPNIHAIQPTKFTTRVALYTKEPHVQVSLETDSHHIPQEKKIYTAEEERYKKDERKKGSNKGIKKEQRNEGKE